jgi:prepilin-type N-terminal cleavage/methylation domain-containing protein
MRYRLGPMAGIDMKSIKETNMIFPRKTGFTLIEVLVVVAIISVLVAMLLPALNSARNRAWTVACQSNERQIGLAVGYFISDHNDYFPRHDTAFHRNAVYNFLTNYGAGIPGREEAHPTGVWICPADPAPKNYPRTYPNPADNFNQYTFWAWYGKPIYVSYAYNIDDYARSEAVFHSSSDPYGLSAYDIDDTDKPHVRRLDEIQSPSRMMVFVCGWAFRTLAYPGYWLDPGTPTHHTGNNLQASLLAVDGHSEMVKTIPGDLPEIPGFWFRRDN